ncbi:triple tyrosine motif-containing protein [Alphaproteobacteria bacterium LSUCC0719]
MEARDPDGDLRPLVIKRKTKDGNFVLDDRFEVSGGKLIAKAGQTFDFEHEDNPNGVITLEITAEDSAGNEVKKEVTVQLTDGNDPTTGIISILVNGKEAKEAFKGVTLSVDRSATDQDIVGTINTDWERKKADGTWEPAPGRPPSNNDYTPSEAGIYRAVMLVSDVKFSDDDEAQFVSPEIEVKEPSIENFKVIKRVSRITENSKPSPTNPVDAGYEIHIAKNLLPADFLSSKLDAVGGLALGTGIQVLSQNIVRSSSTAYGTNDPRFALKFNESDENYHKFTLLLFMIRGPLKFDADRTDEFGDDNNLTLNGIIELTFTFTDEYKTERKFTVDVAIDRPTEGAIAAAIKGVAVDRDQEVNTGTELSFIQTTPFSDPNSVVLPTPAGGVRPPAMGLTLKYQWWQKVNEVWKAITGATSASYTPDEAGTYRLLVTVTDTVSGVATDFKTLDINVVAGSAPSVGGSTQSGSALDPAVPDFKMSFQTSVGAPPFVENVGAGRQGNKVHTGHNIQIKKDLLPTNFLGTRGPDGTVTVIEGRTGELNPSYLTFTTRQHDTSDGRFMLEFVEETAGHYRFFLYARQGATFNFEKDVREEEAGNADGKIAVTIIFTDRNGIKHTLDSDPDTPGNQPFLVTIRNKDEKPTGIALKAPDDASLAFTGITINELEPTTERKIADIHISDDGIGTNVLEIQSAWAKDLFEIRNGTELMLKAGQVIDRLATGTREVAVGLTDRTTGDGTLPNPVSFTVTINNTEEAPRLEKHVSPDAPSELPLRTEDTPFDTGIVFILSDPDNLDGVPVQDVQMLPLIVKIDGVAVSVDVFELVRDTSYVLPPRSTPGQKKYKLMVKAGQDLSDLAGRSVTLTIQGRENGNHGTLKSEGIEVTLNVAAAPVPGLPAAQDRPTTPETPDTHDGQTGSPDTREVDTTPGNAASADRINNLESGDKIRIDLDYVWLKSYSRTVDSIENISVLGIYSSHDLSLEDNHLAFMVNSVDTVNFPSVFLNVGYSNKDSYFTTRSGDSTTVTKAYYLFEGNSLSNSENRNEAFVIDTTPSDEDGAVKITNFRPAEGDALVFTGSDIYWQVKYDAGGFGESPSYKLVFYSSDTVQANNVLAVLDGYIHEEDGGLVFVAPTADLFLNVGGNRPNLHMIPVERKHFDISKFESVFNSATGRDEPNYILQPLEGVNFVTDYFNPHYDRVISGAQIKNNEPARITNFEDGRDKIMLDVGENRTYWWKEISETRESTEVGGAAETIRVIELYNTATPTSEAHKIARIVDFDGTFSQDDFIHVDGTSVNSGQIIEIL